MAIIMIIIGTFLKERERERERDKYIRLHLLSRITLQHRVHTSRDIRLCVATAIAGAAVLLTNTDNFLA